MRRYPVPALFDERPREFGGLITLKQAGYLGTAMMLALLAVLDSPPWLALPAAGVGLLGAAALAFGLWRGLPADRVLWLWLRYASRPRAVTWQGRGEVYLSEGAG